jgi:hypothetical protein
MTIRRGLGQSVGIAEWSETLAGYPWFPRLSKSQCPISQGVKHGALRDIVVRATHASGEGRLGLSLVM